MLLSAVRKLEDLVLWDFCTTAINLLQFYKQLLAWCEYMDQVNPNPPKQVVAYPERCDISNEPLLDSITGIEEDNAQTITFSETPKKSSSVQSPTKRLAGKKRLLSKPLSPPDPKTPKLDPTTPTQVNKTGSPSAQPSNSSNAFVVLHTVTPW